MRVTATPQSGGLEKGARRTDLVPEGSFGLLLDVAAPWFRWFDWRAVQQPDLVLANSAHTANRIQAAWGRDAAVVYPPVRTHFFTPGASPRDDFLLWVSGLNRPNSLIG